ncbi:MAG TPA: AmmeMemoRadiSam system protein B [Bacteroidota bacterium]|nr:AmmeMemoRadiSam system protein B [Bacteroidota bacterium]
MSTIREPAVAGMFYPAIPTQLHRELDELFRSAKPRKVEGTLLALIAPHAGYMYSGSTAAVGYKLLSSLNFDTVVVVGPSHREYFRGISVFSGDAYRTPLGDVPIDMKLREELVAQSEAIVMSHVGHRAEHSVEVQLPFLQKVLRNFTFLPIVMGDQRREYCDILADALAATLKNRNALLIASSDLSHYHPHDVALQLDKRVIQEVEAYNPDGLMEKLERDEVEACGGGPMVAVMKAAKMLGSNRSYILHHCTSGDITGEKDAVVGYLSVALAKVN